jgi:hypothetical protein
VADALVITAGDGERCTAPRDEAEFLIGELQRYSDGVGDAAWGLAQDAHVLGSDGEDGLLPAVRFAVLIEPRRRPT